MRLLNIEDSNQGHGRKVALVCMNVNELALLQSFASELGESLPKHGPTARLRAVARQMTKEMASAVKQLEDSGDKKSKLVFPHDDKAIV